jgi:hypothetical protein
MISPSAPPSGRPSPGMAASRIPRRLAPTPGQYFFGEKSLMLDLPKTIDADVVIEIDRMLNDRSKTAPVPVPTGRNDPNEGRHKAFCPVPSPPSLRVSPSGAAKTRWRRGLRSSRLKTMSAALSTSWPRGRATPQRKIANPAGASDDRVDDARGGRTPKQVEAACQAFLAANRLD